MNNNKQVLLIVVGYLVFSTVAVLGNNPTYDGHWWLSSNQRQRGGFVHGFALCYSHFLDRNVFHEGIPAYSARLTDYLQAHPESLPEPVEETLLKIAGPPYAKIVHRPPSNETPQQLAAKWGPYDSGDEWRGTDSWHLGYVQGFLQCYSKHTKQNHGTFSKPSEWYVTAISAWYGTKADDPDAINPTREEEKIPDVLFRFRDRPAGK